MLLARHRVRLVRQHPQCANHLAPCLVRLDHVIDVTALGRHKRIREAIAILLDLLLPALFGIVQNSSNSRRYRMFTAPSGPMTAISAVG